MDTMIRMSDYSYVLKEESIARYPASPRGSSKLCRLNGTGDLQFYDNFSNHFARIAKGSHIVFNDSRVMDARLFVKENIELMVLDLGSVEVDAPCRTVSLRSMLRTSRVHKGDILKEDTTGTEILVNSVEGIWEEDEKSDGNGMECMVQIQSDYSLQEFLEKAGSVPIPPYFHRKAEESDSHAYNNVYAAENGSVAAPTAGLHFTPEVMDEIGVENTTFLTLHVGAGTFKPVLKENAAEHDMHAESFVVGVIQIKRLIRALRQDQPLIVVGTTSCRTLESLYWCGAKLLAGQSMDPENMNLAQFEWKALDSKFTAVEALEAVLDCAEEGNRKAVRGRTSLMITPNSYSFRLVNHLVTNFHAPDSTLMLLVAAFSGGPKIREVYETAQDKGYRFLSYGDVCLFSRLGHKLPSEIDRILS